MAEQLDITLRRYAPGFWVRGLVMLFVLPVVIVSLVGLLNFGLRAGWLPLVALLTSLAVFAWALLTLPFRPRLQTDVSLRTEGVVLVGGRSVINPLYGLGSKSDPLTLHWSDFDLITRHDHRANVTFRLRIREDRAWEIFGNLLARSVPVHLWQSDIGEDRLLATLGQFLGQNGLQMTAQKHGAARRVLYGVTKEWTIAPTSPHP